MACSTCDGYQLVDSDGDGVYDAACPDCRANVKRCPQHGRTLHNGRCASCLTGARIAEETITAGMPLPLHPLAGSIA